MSKWGMYPHLEGALMSKRSWALMSIFGHKGGPDMTTEPEFYRGIIVSQDHEAGCLFDHEEVSGQS